MDVQTTQGERIRNLFRGASNGSIIAPFIKLEAFLSLLREIPPHVRLRCVTRWLPQEVAAGVSDPEILEALDERGSSELYLVDRLHAKIYIADDRCLAGSANVTGSGLGEGAKTQNIEVLIDTRTDDPAIIETLELIETEARPATPAMAKTVRLLADALNDQNVEKTRIGQSWHPISKQPERAFRLYASPPRAGGFINSAERLLLLDIAMLNLRPGLTEDEFHSAIRALLAAIPASQTLLRASTDTVVTRAEVSPFLEKIATEEYRAPALWQAFVVWMSYFFDDMVTTQEISEIALRRAQRMSDF